MTIWAGGATRGFTPGYPLARLRPRDDRYLHFAFSSEEAELWILERYLCEINGLPDKPRGCHEDER